MARQTAFPGVLVESIRVEKPPFDKSGVIQEAVGQGATREFDAPKLAEDLPPQRIQEIINEMEESIGPLRSTYKVRYNLLTRVVPAPEIRGPAPVRQLQTRAARVRARMFTRAKNPFEPGVLKIGEPSKDESMSEDSQFDIYRVPTWVSK